MLVEAGFSSQKKYQQAKIFPHKQSHPVEMRRELSTKGCPEIFECKVDQRLRAILLPDDVAGDQSLPRVSALHARAGADHAAAWLQQTAWAAFLDTQKAFDSFDHAEMLDILRHRLPLECVEVMRRLLCSNSITVYAVPVATAGAAHRGARCPQHSASASWTILQPPSCQLRDHPEDLSSTLRFCFVCLGSRQLARVLAHLLLVADDVIVVTDSLAALQRLLNVEAGWE